jgi:hypothetical protein
MSLSINSFKVSSPNRKTQDVADATPTISAVSDGGAAGEAAFDEIKVSVAYSSPTGGIPDAYRVVSSPGGIISIGAAPVSVRGLAPGTSYTFTATPRTFAGTLGATSLVSSAETPTGGMVPIMSHTFLTSSIANYTLVNIPQTYQDLVLVFTGRRTDAVAVGNVLMTPSSNQSQPMSTTILTANGSSASSSRFSSQDTWFAGQVPGSSATAGIMGSTILHIFDYASTTKFKTAISRSSSDRNGSGDSSVRIHLSRNLIPVTGIDVSTFSGSAFFVAGSTMTLYGIKRFA